MKTIDRENRTTRRIAPVAGALALAVGLMGSLSSMARADGGGHGHHIDVPAVPDNLNPPDGSEVFLVGHAIGTQNYVCLPSGAGFAWTLFTPQATLFDDHHKQLITHFFSPNPDEDGTPIRATWQDSRDSSRVWAKLHPNGISTDAPFVKTGAVAWLLLDTAGTEEGPSGGGTLTKTVAVQRLNTSGGLAPATGCSQSTDVGSKAFMPYEADYFFYRIPDGDGDDRDN
jgi:uncharacterized protein DUF3455